MIRSVLLLFLLLPACAVAQYDRPGSTDAQFLKIGVSPRGTAMGDAYIAVVHGAEATYYNSAALPWTKGVDIVFNHTRWFAGINHEFVSAVMNMDAIGTFGVSVTALYTDEMSVTTPLQPDGTGETFYAGNYRVGLSYARFLTDRVTFGATVNYLTMSLYQDFRADAVSLDIATMYQSEFHGFRFGMQISNFGSNIQYVNESYPLPTNFTFGLAMNPYESDEHSFVVSFSASKPNEGKPLAQCGAEWTFMKMFSLRGGYRLNHAVADYSFGAGISSDVSGFAVRCDYSYSNYLLLGAAHRFGIGVGF